MNLDQLVMLARDLIKEPTAANWSAAEAARKINTRHRMMAGELINMSVGFFLRYVDMNYVANQFDYDLPALCARVHRVERIDGQYPQEVIPISLAESWAHRSILGLNPYRSLDAYALVGQKIRIVPTPTTSITGAARIHYAKRQPQLVSGTLASATSTTVTLGAVPSSGVLDITDDAYEGTRLQLTGGTGSGQIRSITASNATTRVLTVSAWTTTPDATTTYSIIPEIPEEWHDLIAYGAAIDLMISSKEDTSELTREYERFESIMRTQLGIRQEQSAMRVIHIPE